MDLKIYPRRWSATVWPLTMKLGVVAVAGILVAITFATVRLPRGGARTIRIPTEQLTFASVNQGIFHDLIPLRAHVVPRETLYIDAIDGGRVDRVLVESGDMVEAGQPLIALSNTNLALQVVQQESQLNQAISQLQQNEIALEQNKLSNERALADIDYNLLRLERSAARRESLAAKGATSVEQRDVIADELIYYKRLKSIQAESGHRQAELRSRLLPDIHQQLKILRSNLGVVRYKLDSLVIRAPVAGQVTAIDLKVGENRSPGQRLAELTPKTGIKLSAEIDESYFSRVHKGQPGTANLDGKQTNIVVRRVSPQIRGGRFKIDLDFDGGIPPSLVAGAEVHGHLQLQDDTPAKILSVGPFLENTGDPSVFVVADDNKSAKRRQIKAGRRTSEQLEILDGLSIGEKVITSDYDGLEDVDLLILIE